MMMYKRRRLGLLIILFAVFATSFVFSDSDMDDSLFGEATESDGPFIEEIPSTEGIELNLLVVDEVELGGRYSFSGRSSWVWDDPPTDTASIDLGATLFFDARPLESFRVFGKASISYPFEEVIHIDELFSDFNWNDVLFLRGGKHTINWGVGYFFSPADLLSVTEIDPEDPAAEREGPVSLKAHLPLDAHNLYLYLVAGNVQAWDDIGIAGKAELVFGSMEVGIGALYQKDVAPSAMLTFSASLWDIDFFGEGVLRYGSDKTYVVESDTAPLGVETVTYDDELFYHATAGFSFAYTPIEVDSSLRLTGQYLYNGEGYSNPSIFKDNAAGVGALLGSGNIAPTDLMSSGMHYAAASAGWSGIFGSDLALQVFWIHNFSDTSGRLSPAITLALFDGMNLTLQTPYHYGEEGDEYSPTGDGVSFQLSVSLGGGSF